MDKKLARVIALSVAGDTINEFAERVLDRGYTLDDDERRKIEKEIQAITSRLFERATRNDERL